MGSRTKTCQVRCSDRSRSFNGHLLNRIYLVRIVDDLHCFCRHSDTSVSNAADLECPAQRPARMYAHSVSPWDSEDVYAGASIRGVITRGS